MWQFLALRIDSLPQPLAEYALTVAPNAELLRNPITGTAAARGL
jgi:hypothetical protein